MTHPFRLHPPSAPPMPIVANLPHSGQLVPSEILERLDPAFQNYLPNQDWHLDHLYDFLPEMGITVLQALYSRYVVDLNRAAKAPYFGSFWQSVIAEKTAFDVPLYRTPPSPLEVQQRIEQYYDPYHEQLQRLLDGAIAQFGTVYLLDLHSFLGLIEDEICLGNGNGKSCGDRLISTVDAAFTAQGYQVVRNKVFSGGYITRHYGESPQVEALQIEVRYPVYLNAQQLNQDRVPDWQGVEFDRAKDQFQAVFRQIIDALILIQ